ncbi:MAG TPA: hypothetical protein DDZ90_28615 [Planctomycetaceae bacterium]|nr:hypothetical protein [Gimesia sp.]HBL47354.1 hypothetical protein [Planctomycetaceae bacterium]
MSDFALKEDSLAAGNRKSERLLQIIHLDEESQISPTCWQPDHTEKYTFIHYPAHTVSAYSAQPAISLNSAKRHPCFANSVIYPILAGIICEKASMYLVPTRNSLNDAGMWVIAGKRVMPENASGHWSA